MKYMFLILAAAWSFQFLLSYYQLQHFHRALVSFRKRGRCAVGMYGNRWRGRTYGVLVIDAQERVRHAALFSGWSVFSTLKPIDGLDGTPLATMLSTDTPLAGIRQTHWRALQHAAHFFTPASAAATHTPRSTSVSH